MDITKDEMLILSQEKEDKASSFKKEKNIYNIVNSDELELLYKKNAHLLDRLSKTGKENTHLYTKLSSLNKKASHLGDKNTILKSKYLGLKEQISLFARQHREFNYQSHQLKKELRKVKTLQAQDDVRPEVLDNYKKEIHLLKKKEQVYTKQIQNLQDVYKKTGKNKQDEQKSLKRNYEQNTQLQEEKNSNLCKMLDAERKKKNQSSSQVKEMQEVTKSLNQQIKELEKKNEGLREKERKWVVLQKKYENGQEKHREENQDLQSCGKEKTKQLAVISEKLRGLEKENQLFKKREKKFNQMSEKLQKEKQIILEGSKKIKVKENKIQKFMKDHEDLLYYKNQNSVLIKQKEQLQSGFADQINLFNKERDSLKFQCDGLKKALSVGKLGFDQAMLSFQRKYMELYQKQQNLQKQIKQKGILIQSLKDKAILSEKQFLQEKEEAKMQISKQRDKYISELRGELKASREHNKDLESQVYNLKTESEKFVLTEKKQMQEQIKDLSWGKDKELLHREECHKGEIEGLKSDYEQRIANLESGFNRKLQHIRTEMENDLCSEKKRHEIFKDMKNKQMQELKDGLSLLQKQSNELKIQKFVLEKSLGETSKSLDRHLKNSKKWEDQNQNLKTLWQELQKQNETKDQQIRSLQKLNKSLSLSLNQKKKQEDFIQNQSPSLFSDQVSMEDLKEDNKESSSRVLADIHFD